MAEIKKRLQNGKIMKMRSYLLACLIGASSLVMMSCSGASEKSEVKSGVKSAETNVVSKQDTIVSESQDDTTKIRDVDEINVELSRVERESRERHSKIDELNTQLNALLEEAGEKPASREDLERKINEDRQRLSEEIVAIFPEIDNAIESIKLADQEFSTQSEFGNVDALRETLLYVFGFKWLWGVFNLYRPSFYYYNPDYSTPLLSKLAEHSGTLTDVRQLLLSSVSVARDSEGVMLDVSKAYELVNGALEFYSNNTSGVKTHAVSDTHAVFMHLFDKTREVEETLVDQLKLLESMIKSGAVYTNPEVQVLQDKRQHEEVLLREVEARVNDLKAELEIAQQRVEREA